MRRAYYDQNNGMITLVVPEEFAPKIADPYITISDKINVNEYRINVTTRTLEALPEDQILRVFRRGSQL